MNCDSFTSLPSFTLGAIHTWELINGIDSYSISLCFAQELKDSAPSIETPCAASIRISTLRDLCRPFDGECRSEPERPGRLKIQEETNRAEFRGRPNFPVLRWTRWRPATF